MNKKLEDQVTRMRVAITSMFKQGQRLTANLTNLKMDRTQLWYQLDNFKEYVKNEMQIANANMAKIALPMKKEMHKLSETDIAGKSLDANHLMHHMKSCREELQDLEAYLQEQLVLSYQEPGPKKLAVANLTATGTANGKFMLAQDIQTGATFWKKLAESLMAQTLPLETAINKLSTENKRLFIENQQLEKSLQQP